MWGLAESGPSGRAPWAKRSPRIRAPVAFKGKLLLVHANSSPWLHHLQFLKKEIIVKVNQALGRELVGDIKFKIGKL